jgi:hypothetical protein
MSPIGDPTTAELDALRSHIPARPHHPGEPAHVADGPRVSVMEWLLGVGHMVARRLHRGPTSPMARIHVRR